MRILFFFMALLSGVAHANAIDRDHKSHDDEETVSVNSWRFSLSLGYGVIDSPVLLHENFDFYALPSISWYGERFYFENGLSGFSLYENTSQQFDIVLYPGFEGVLFNLSHANTLSLLTPIPYGTNEVFILELADRDLAWMGGLRYAYRWQGMEWALSLATDTSDVHDGWESALSFQHFDAIKGEQWQLGYRLRASYKSQSIVDYYYGFQADDLYVLPLSAIAEARAGFLYEAQLNADYRLSSHWTLNALYRYSEYDQHISASPILETAKMQTWFAGVGYNF